MAIKLAALFKSPQTQQYFWGILVSYPPCESPVQAGSPLTPAVEARR